MKHILLVEDVALNREIIEDIFRFDQIEADLFCVESGEEALSHVKKRKPDLILMDIGLPGIDGLEATRRIKRDPELKDIPVWAITAHAMKGDEEYAKDAGCSAYISKPIDGRQFADRLRNFIEHSGSVKGIGCTDC
jgi:two-component system, cell cycle response regulator DivK